MVATAASDAACRHSAPSKAAYARRRPETTVLHKVVREHLETLLSECSSRSASGRGYPAHVEDEFRRYLDCGILANGFLRVHCEVCNRDELVAFSCKGRGLCPSCIGRRTSELSTRLVDERLPCARYRQWTFSFPWSIRLALARDSGLLSKVFSICKSKVFANQRKRARWQGLAGARSLAVSCVQRFGSLLQANLHNHSVVPDGVFADDADGQLTFFELPPPSDADVESIALGVAKAVCKAVARAESPNEEDDEVVEDTRAGSASGPFVRGETEAERKHKPRCAKVQSELGMFSVHADTAVDADNRAGLERLIRYASRPPLAQKRLSLDAAGRVRYKLRRPYYTGQTELCMEPVEFLRKLAALVPPRRQNQVRFYGLLAPQAHDRERFELLMPVPPGQDHEPEVLDGDDAATFDTVGVGQRAATRKRWAQLLKRVFQTDALICPTCKGPRRIIAAITEREPIVKILSSMGLSTDVPLVAKARPPPQDEFFFDHDEPC